MAVYTDAFTGSADTDLDVYSSTWVDIGVNHDTAEIGAANNIRHDADTAGGGYRYNQTFNSKHYAKLKLTTLGGVGPAIRMAGADQSAGSFYYCIPNPGGGVVYNGECEEGGYTDWDSGQAEISANDVLELWVDATTETTIIYKVNGGTVETYTLKDALSGGQAGLCTYGADWIADDWEGGDVGGTSTPKSFAGTMALAEITGVLTKQDKKSLDGGLSPSGTIAKSDGKGLAGGLTPSGTIAKSDAKSLVGGDTPSGTLVKQGQKSFAGENTPGGVLSKVLNLVRTLEGGLTPSGTVAKSDVKTLEGGLTPSGALSNVKAVLRTFVGEVTSAGTIVKQVAKELVGGDTPSGVLGKVLSIYRTLTGGITPTGTVIAEKPAVDPTVTTMTPWW